MSISKEEVGQVVTSCMEMDLEQLRNINKIIVARIKDKRKAKARKMAKRLNKGDIVRADYEDLRGIDGVVEKVKRTRADVNFNGKVYTCPMSMLLKVEG